MDPRLLVTNIGYIMALIMFFGIGVFVLSRGPRKFPNILFFLMSMTEVVWEISYVVGINLADPEQSRLAFMFNIVTIFTAVTTAHMVLYVTGRLPKQKYVIRTFYVIGALITGFFLLYPHLFLDPSQPKLYFPNFFVPGQYYFVGDIFFFTVLVYFIYHLTMGYRKADRMLRNRLRYFIVAIAFGWTVALVPEFLLYGINIDPLISALVGFYTIPMAYAIIQYDLIDINIVAKRAFWYALGVTAVALGITFINAANDALIASIAYFPHWFLPVISGIIAVGTGVLVWKKIREVDILKYEFINVVTHKFRTPLTQIKWSAEMLKTMTGESAGLEKNKAISIIEDADTHLVELTNTLIGLVGKEKNEYLYHFNNEDLGALAQDSVEKLATRAEEKKITVSTRITPNLPHISGDKTRLQFAIQTILENALNYTPQGGTVNLSLRLENKQLLLSVHDTGVGIPKEEIRYVFSKFFRGTKAKLMDTEGFGIGLFVTKDIIDRHHGRIWIESPGVNQGTTVFMQLPAMNPSQRVAGK